MYTSTEIEKTTDEVEPEPTKNITHAKMAPARPVIRMNEIASRESDLFLGFTKPATGKLVAVQTSIISWLYICVALQIYITDRGF